MEDGNVEMRHYAVRANPVGVSKSVKRIIEAKLPDLGSLEVMYYFYVKISKGN
jgi:ribosome biogenesis protein SSF1/2